MRRKLYLALSIALLGFTLSSCNDVDFRGSDFDVEVPEKDSEATMIDNEKDFTKIMVDLMDDNGDYAKAANSFFDKYKTMMVCREFDRTDTYGLQYKYKAKSIYETETKRLYYYVHFSEINAYNQLMHDYIKEFNLDYSNGVYYAYLDMELYNAQYSFFDGTKRIVYRINGSAKLTCSFKESKFGLSNDSIKKNIINYVRPKVDLNLASSGYDGNVYVVDGKDYLYVTYDKVKNEDSDQLIQIIDNKLMSYSSRTTVQNKEKVLTNIQYSYFNKNVIGSIKKDGYQEYDLYNQVSDFGFTNYIVMPYNLIIGNINASSTGTKKLIEDNFELIE